jgi:hypothetical protein
MARRFAFSELAHAFPSRARPLELVRLPQQEPVAFRHSLSKLSSALAESQLLFCAIPSGGAVAKFTKNVAEFTKIAIFALFACKNGRNFVHLPCLFQPKTEDSVQNEKRI